jgi:hypothetical protein
LESEWADYKVLGWMGEIARLFYWEPSAAAALHWSTGPRHLHLHLHLHPAPTHTHTPLAARSLETVDGV